MHPYAYISNIVIYYHNNINILEPVVLYGEGIYNLNVLKEIKVTDSYLGLDEKFKNCQNEESIHSCTTRHYIRNFLDHCGCLPKSIRVLMEVTLVILIRNTAFEVLGSFVFKISNGMHPKTWRKNKYY